MKSTKIDVGTSIPSLLRLKWKNSESHNGIWRIHEDNLPSQSLGYNLIIHFKTERDSVEDETCTAKHSHQLVRKIIKLVCAPIEEDQRLTIETMAKISDISIASDSTVLTGKLRHNQITYGNGPIKPKWTSQE